jgi:hypothetical protein
VDPLCGVYLLVKLGAILLFYSVSEHTALSWLPPLCRPEDLQTNTPIKPHPLSLSLPPSLSPSPPLSLSPSLLTCPACSDVTYQVASTSIMLAVVIVMSRLAITVLLNSTSCGGVDVRGYRERRKRSRRERERERGGGDLVTLLPSFPPFPPTVPLRRLAPVVAVERRKHWLLQLPPLPQRFDVVCRRLPRPLLPPLVSFVASPTHPPPSTSPPCPLTG